MNNTKSNAEHKPTTHGANAMYFYQSNDPIESCLVGNKGVWRAFTDMQRRNFLKYDSMGEVDAEATAAAFELWCDAEN